MAVVDLIMPKMGESIIEATILKWLKQVGDTIEADESILEIATDKVDSEIPSPVSGVLTEILYEQDAIVAVDTVIARISTEGESTSNIKTIDQSENVGTQIENQTPSPEQKPQIANIPISAQEEKSVRFYSPLVKNIAKKENISIDQLDTIQGSGANGRVTKKDILAFIAQSVQSTKTANIIPQEKHAITHSTKESASNPQTSASGNVEIIEMDRMRKLIADHMVKSKATSPHVTSFVEADVTNIVKWRSSIKQEFIKKYQEKITYTPIFMEAIVKAILDFPMINVSVEDDNIIKKKDINVGMATALPNGNLIVPVIKNADSLNLIGLTKSVNDLAYRARENKLKPTEIQNGTFTLTNVGTFGNVMGTPIINQPQVAIMAAGAIRKKPAVVETKYGDLIAIRHMMFLSLSYDHRVVDGFLGGSFLKRVADYLEKFDINRSI